MSEQYAKVATRLLGHRKFMGLSFEARGLWLTGLLHAKDQLTGGFVAQDFLDWGTGCQPPDPSTVRELADRGLWDAAPAGWQMHDWEDHQTDPLDPAQAGRRSAEVRREKYGTAQPRTRSANGSAEPVRPKVPRTLERRPETGTGTVSPSGDTPPVTPPAKGSAEARTFTELWNANCAPLPTMRRPPTRQDPLRLVLSAWEHFDGDEAAIARAVRRCALDEHYRAGGFGFEAFCRHPDRFTADRVVIPHPASAAERRVQEREAFLTRNGLGLEAVT